MLNRVDRLASVNYGMPINSNLYKNKFVKQRIKTIILQVTSIYTEGSGERWNVKEMFDIMLKISKISLHVLDRDIFNQITQNID